MTQAVHVRAPCRLHFGMFSFGHADRPQFGGVGVMIDPPAVEVAITPGDRLSVSGSLSERAKQFVESAATAWRLKTLPPCQISVGAPSDHLGLGVGTQLGLAIAAGLRRFLELPDLSIEALAASVGRASRSAVGTYGFHLGGFIVDAGREPGKEVGWAPPTTRLKQRVALPAAWRFVLVRPANERGLAGASEADAFARLPAVPENVTQVLWRITEEEMLPSIERADCAAFGEAVYRYGRLAGECFAAVQGGPFASAEIARLVEAIRSRDIAGVGQSSWGPTVFAACASEAEAQSLAACLRDAADGIQRQITIARPNNRGAVID